MALVTVILLMKAEHDHIPDAAAARAVTAWLAVPVAAGSLAWSLGRLDPAIRRWVLGVSWRQRRVAVGWAAVFGALAATVVAGPVPAAVAVAAIVVAAVLTGAVVFCTKVRF